MAILSLLNISTPSAEDTVTVKSGFISFRKASVQTTDTFILLSEHTIATSSVTPGVIFTSCEPTYTGSSHETALLPGEWASIV